MIVVAYYLQNISFENHENTLKLQNIIKWRTDKLSERIKNEMGNGNRPR